MSQEQRVSGSGASGAAASVGAATAAASANRRPEESVARVLYCGEEYDVAAGQDFVIGREADLSIDDNPYLHRRFMLLSFSDGLWWIENIGSRLAATVADASGMLQAWVGPGARLPLVFDAVTVVFSAGSTTYEFDVEIQNATYRRTELAVHTGGEKTVGEVSFTPTQYLLILALAEPCLLRAGAGSTEIPRSAEAAKRLGWAITRFNRKLDNVADKLDRMGVAGMRGGSAGHATYRRARLVEYAIASRLVRREDLYLLDEERRRNA